jgi:acetyltransferase
MLRVRTIAGLFAAAQTLAQVRSSSGDRLVILTNTGGAGVVATDALIDAGGALSLLLPPYSSPENPIDLGGDATPTRYAEALKLLLNEPVPDAILVIHGPSGPAKSREIGEACAAVVGVSPRNVLACWMGGERARDSRTALQRAGVAIHDTPEAAVQAFVHIVSHRRNQEALQEAPSSIPLDFTPDHAAAERLLDETARANRTLLGDPEAKRLLAAYGIAAAVSRIASTGEEAANVAAQIGYPVALKVVSPEIEHRADVGGIMFNLESADEVRRAASDISRRMRQFRPDATLAGFTVERMIRKPGTADVRRGAHELVLEALEDRIFGPVICIRSSACPEDAAVGLVPLNAALAWEMLTRTRLPAILAGTRSRPAADVHARIAAARRPSGDCAGQDRSAGLR